MNKTILRDHFLLVKEKQNINIFPPVEEKVISKHAWDQIFDSSPSPIFIKFLNIW